MKVNLEIRKKNVKNIYVLECFGHLSKLILMPTYLWYNKYQPQSVCYNPIVLVCPLIKAITRVRRMPELIGSSFLQIYAKLCLIRVRWESVRWVWLTPFMFTCSNKRIHNRIIQVCYSRVILLQYMLISV